MSQDLQTAPGTGGPNLTALVSGIVSDAQDLIKQQFAFLGNEVKRDLAKGRDIAVMFGAGAVVAVIGGIMLLTMVVYLLHEKAGLDLWASYGIVGLVAAAAGAALLVAGKAKLDKSNLLPDETASEVARTVSKIQEAV